MTNEQLARKVMETLRGMGIEYFFISYCPPNSPNIVSTLFSEDSKLFTDLDQHNQKFFDQIDGQTIKEHRMSIDDN